MQNPGACKSMIETWTKLQVSDLVEETQIRQFQKQKVELTVLDLFRVLSRQQNKFVFSTVATEGMLDAEMINKMLNTNKRAQSKSLSELSRFDLIQRKSGKYYITSLGKIIYDLQIRAENMLTLRHNLKVVDSIKDFADNRRNEVINCIIKDEYAKHLLMQSDRRVSYSKQNKLTEKEEHPPLHGNIMILEDESDLLFTYEEILREEGYDVYGFIDPFKALETLLDFYNFKGKKIDLLIADISMPRLNGLQAYKTFKAVDETIKTLFVSALADAHELLRVYPGDDSVQLLKKPIGKDHLIREVRSLLSL
jgi:CheY-like chemotaxis protein/predicted transcriptional regulator